MSTIKASHLQKSYKKRPILKDVSFEFSQGEIVGLLGPNGSGKTTSFYIVVGLVSCEKGSVALDNQDITKAPMHQRAKMGLGYLPQEPSIFRKMSVEDNIMSILQMQPISKEEKKAKLESLLEEFHITHIRKSLGLSLSGGERRRAEIARSLASNPSFLLFDEPFAGVDPLSVNESKELIRALTKKNVGIFITDHNVRETLDICDRSYVLIDGKIVAQGTREEIYKNSQVRTSYLGENFKA